MSSSIDIADDIDPRVVDLLAQAGFPLSATSAGTAVRLGGAEPVHPTRFPVAEAAASGVEALDRSG